MSDRTVEIILYLRQSQIPRFKNLIGFGMDQVRYVEGYQGLHDYLLRQITIAEDGIAPQLGDRVIIRGGTFIGHDGILADRILHLNGAPWYAVQIDDTTRITGQFPIVRMEEKPDAPKAHRSR